MLFRIGIFNPLAGEGFELRDDVPGHSVEAGYGKQNLECVQLNRNVFRLSSQVVERNKGRSEEARSERAFLL